MLTSKPKIGIGHHSVAVERYYKIGSQVRELRGLSMRMNFRPWGPCYTGTVVRCFETANAGWIVIEDGQQKRHVLCIG